MRLVESCIPRPRSTISIEFAIVTSSSEDAFILHAFPFSLNPAILLRVPIELAFALTVLSGTFIYATRYVAGDDLAGAMVHFVDGTLRGPSSAHGVCGLLSSNCTTTPGRVGLRRKADANDCLQIFGDTRSDGIGRAGLPGPAAALWTRFL